jgi:hypothetical protein
VSTSELDPSGVVFETPANYQRLNRLPIYSLQWSGTLRLFERRLQFVRSRNRPVLDAPVNQFHSFSPCYGGSGFHLWEADRRHVFVFTGWATRSFDADSPADMTVDVLAAQQTIPGLEHARTPVQYWGAVLRPLLAPAPPLGVTVRPPLPKGKFWAAAIAIVCGSLLVFLGIVGAIVALGG